MMMKEVEVVYVQQQAHNQMENILYSFTFFFIRGRPCVAMDIADPFISIFYKETIWIFDISSILSIVFFVSSRSFIVNSKPLYTLCSNLGNGIDVVRNLPENAPSAHSSS
ncbi:hypothetical protein L6452_24015 [Arctium lappa]|uniref:Uncharacterized protein n=1 Tax=Arctium lappa TaxID=4217 RepID=A0ACB9A835_ARCLA|nr:hypothetical protein L6452_24015 [Arctium lappa]